MAEFSIGGRSYNIDRLRLGEIKAIAAICDEPVDPTSGPLLDRFARIVAAGTARFGSDGFAFSDESECGKDELINAAALILTIGGFASGEAPAAAS